MIRKLQGVGSMQNRPGGTGPKVYNTFVYDGKIIYAVLKRYYPDFLKVAFRKYFTVYLTGVLVNDALNGGSPLMDLYLRTQALVNEGTSNFMEQKAKNDMVVREVNKVLARTRVEEMKNYEGYKFTTFPQPGPTMAPLPGQPNPQNTPIEQVRNQPQPGQQPQYGEDITPGDADGDGIPDDEER